MSKQLNIFHSTAPTLDAQLGWGERGRPPLSFFENRKQWPDFGKEGPNYVHPCLPFKM